MLSPQNRKEREFSSLVGLRMKMGTQSPLRYVKIFMSLCYARLPHLISFILNAIFSCLRKIRFSVVDQVSRGNASYRFVFFLMLLPLHLVVRTSRKFHRVLAHPEKENRISNNNPNLIISMFKSTTENKLREFQILDILR